MSTENRDWNPDVTTTTPETGSTDRVEEISRFLHEYLTSSQLSSTDSTTSQNGDGLYGANGNLIDQATADVNQPVFEVTTADDGSRVISFFPSLSARENGENSPARAVLSSGNQGERTLEIFDTGRQGGEPQLRFTSSVFVDPETQQLISVNEAQLGSGLSALQQVVLNPDGSGEFTLIRSQGNGNGSGNGSETERRNAAATFAGTFSINQNGARAEAVVQSMRIIPGSNPEASIPIPLDTNEFPEISNYLANFLEQVQQGRQELLLLPQGAQLAANSDLELGAEPVWHTGDYVGEDGDLYVDQDRINADGSIVATWVDSQEEEIEEPDQPDEQDEPGESTPAPVPWEMFQFRPAWRPADRPDASTSEADEARAAALWELAPRWDSANSPSLAILRRILSSENPAEVGFGYERQNEGSPQDNINAFLLRSYLHARDLGNHADCARIMAMVDEEGRSGRNPDAQVLGSMLTVVNAASDLNSPDEATRRRAHEGLALAAGSNPFATLFIRSLEESENAQDRAAFAPIRDAQLEMYNRQLEDALSGSDTSGRFRAILNLANLDRYSEAARRRLDEYGATSPQALMEVETARRMRSGAMPQLTDTRSNPASRQQFEIVAGFLTAMSSMEISRDQTQRTGEAFRLARRHYGEEAAAPFATVLTRLAAQENTTALGEIHTSVNEAARRGEIVLPQHWREEDARQFLGNLQGYSANMMYDNAMRLPQSVREFIGNELTRIVGERNPTLRDSDRENAGDAAVRQRVALVALREAEGTVMVEVADERPAVTLPPGWPDEADWRRLWQREFDQRFPQHFPDPAEDNLGGHHLDYTQLSFDYLTQRNPNGLNDLRERTYRNEEGSVRDYYCRLQYIDSVRRYESARQEGNTRQRHEALVDLVALQRSSICTDEAFRLIDRYLNGNREAHGISELDITLAEQEVQRRNDEAYLNAGDMLANILTPGRSVNELQEALDRFTAAGIAGDIPGQSTDFVVRYTAVRQVQQAVAGLATDQDLANPDRQNDLIQALTTLNSVFDHDNRLSQAFGGRQALESMLEQLNDDELDADTVRQIRNTLSTALGGAAPQRILRDGEIIASLPLTPRDILRADLLNSHGPLDHLRNYGAVNRLHAALAQMQTEGGRANAANRTELSRALAEIIDLSRTPEGIPNANLDPLFQAFGGRERLQALRTALGGEGGDVGEIVTELSTAMGREVPRSIRERFQTLLRQPGLLESHGNARLQLRQESPRLAASLSTIFGGTWAGANADANMTRIQEIGRASTQFSQSAMRTGDPQAQVFGRWVATASAVSQLDLGVNSTLHPHQRVQAVEAALRNLLASASQPTNPAADVITAFGGTEGINRMLGRLNTAPQEVFTDVATALRSPAVTQMRQDGQAFRRFDDQIANLITSGVFSNPDRLDAARNFGASRRLEQALQQGSGTTANREELVAALQQVLSRSATPAGRQLIEALGGQASLEQLAGRVADRHAQADEGVRGLSAIMRRPAVQDMISRFTRDIRPAVSNDGAAALLRPQIDQAEIAHATEGWQQRNREINTQFNHLESRFLHRPTEAEAPNWARDREAVLRELEQFGLANFAMGGDDTRIMSIPQFRAAHQLLRVQEAQTPQAAAEALRQLHALSESGNPHAREHLNRLLRSGEEDIDIDQLIEALATTETDDESIALQREAMEILRNGLPSGETVMDQLRTEAIIREVRDNPNPTVDALRRAQEALQSEADLNNESAATWRPWAEANRNLARLSLQGAGPATPEDRRAAIDELFRLANEENNDDARQALLSFLCVGQRGDNGLEVDYRRPFVPDLGHLSTEERNALTLRAVGHVQALVDGGHVLNRTEVQTLAQLLGRNTGDSPEQRRIADAVRDVFESAWSNPDQQNDLMAGIFDTLRLHPPVPGRRQLADLFLSHADHPAFAERFQSIVNWATGHDRDAMYIIAGVLGRPETRSEVATLATSAIREFSQSADHRQEFVQAMIESHRTSGDRRVLLATLGEIAGAADANLPPALIQQARAEIRRGLEQTVRANGSPNPELRTSYASAVSGMMSMARHWERDDAQRMVRVVTPEIESGLRTAAANIPEGERRTVIDGLLSRLSTTSQSAGEWLPTIQSLGHMSRYLTVADVQVLTRMDANNPGSLTPQVETALGRTLIQVIQNGATPEVRSEAVRHFTESGWSRSLGREVSNALVAFAQGDMNRVPAELLARVSEVAYDAGVRPPISHVLHMMGVRGVERAHLDAAIARVGGEEQFRQMLSRIVAFNSLPRALQAQIRSGNTDPSTINPEHLLPQLRGNAPEQLNVATIIDHLRNGLLPADLQFLNGNTVTDRINGFNDFMMRQIAERAGVPAAEVRSRMMAMRLGALTGTQVELPDTQAQSERGRRTATMDRLVDTTRQGHGTSLWWNALSPVAYFIARSSNVSDVEARQRTQLRQLTAHDAVLAELAGSWRRMQAINEALDLSQESQRLFTHSANGERREADLLLLNMFNQHGRDMLETFAPPAVTNLTGVGAGAWEGGAWFRLFQNGLTDLPLVPPRYSTGRPEVLQEALATLRRNDLWARPSDADPSFHDPRDQALRQAAHDFLVHEALRALDSNPDVATVTQSAAALTQGWEEFNRLVQAGIQGHRGPELVAHVRRLVNGGTNAQGERVDGFQQQLQRIQESLPQLERVVQEMREARRNMSDPTAIAGIDRRIEALSGMIRNFQPGSPQMRQFDRMFDIVNSGSFDESTIWRTLRDNAVPIALCIVAAAAIVATCGAATPLAALGVAAAIAGSGLIIREGYAEMAYQLRWNRTGGSRLGDSIRSDMHGFLRYDARSGNLVIPPTVLETLGEYGIQFGMETGMNLLMMGAGHYIGRGLNWVTGISDAAQRQVAAQTLNGLLRRSGANAQQFATVLETVAGRAAIPAASRTFWQRMGSELLNQGGFFVASQGLEDGIRNGFNANDTMAHISAALLLVAAHRGVAHVQHYGFNGLRPRWLRPNVLEMPVDRAQFINELRNSLRNAGENAPRTDIVELPNGNVRINVGGRNIEMRFVSPEVALARLNGQPVPPEGAAPPPAVTEGPARPPLTRETVATELNAMVERSQLPRPSAEVITRALNEGRITPEMAQNLANLHGREGFGTAQVTELINLSAQARELTLRAVTERIINPADISRVGRLASDATMRPLVESVLSQPRQEGVNYTELFTSLEGSGYPQPLRNALNFLVGDGAIPLNRLQQLLTNNPAGLRSFLESHAGQISRIMELRAQMENSQWNLISRNLSRLRTALVGGEQSGPQPELRRPNLSQLNGENINQPIENLATQLQAVLGGNLSTVPAESHAHLRSLSQALARYRRGAGNLNEVLEGIQRLAPHEGALATSRPAFGEALNAFRSRLGPLPETQTRLASLPTTEAAMRTQAPELLRSLEALRAQLAPQLSGESRANLQSIRDGLVNDAVQTDAFLRIRLQEFGIRLAPTEPITREHINQISDQASRTQLNHVLNELNIVRGTPERPGTIERLNEILNSTEPIDRCITQLQNFIAGRGNFTTLQTELTNLNGRLGRMQTEIANGNRMSLPRNMASNRNYQDLAVDLALARQEMLRGLTQEGLRGAAQNNTWPEHPTNIIWEGPVQADGSRPRITVPRESTQPPDLNGPRPDTPGMVIELMGTDGRPYRVTIPPGCRVEAARSGDGIVLHADMARAVDGSYLTFRIMQPKNLSSDHHVDYTNGYVRVSRTYPNSQVNVLGADGRPLRIPVGADGQPIGGIDGRTWCLNREGNRIVHVNELTARGECPPALVAERTRLNGLMTAAGEGVRPHTVQRPLTVPTGPDGQPIMGIDGNPWCLSQDGRRVVHINELRGGTCPGELTAARDRLNRISGLWQGFTHHHISPRALPPGTPTIPAPTGGPAGPKGPGGPKAPTDAPAGPTGPAGPKAPVDGPGGPKGPKTPVETTTPTETTPRPETPPQVTPVTPPTDLPPRRQALLTRINESSLPAPLKEAMARYIEAQTVTAQHLRTRLPLFERLGRLSAEHLEAAGITPEALNGMSRSQLTQRIRYAEARVGIESSPPEVQAGLRTLLGNFRRNDSTRLEVVEDYLRLTNAERRSDLGQAIELYIRHNPRSNLQEIRGALDTIFDRRPTPELNAVRPPAGPPVPRPELQSTAAEVFTEARRGLDINEWSPAEVTRAQNILVDMLANHLPGVRPTEVHMGNNQVAVMLDNGCVLKIQRNNRWDPNYGERVFSADGRTPVFDCPIIPITPRVEGQPPIQVVGGSGQPPWIVYMQPRVGNMWSQRHVDQFFNGVSETRAGDTNRMVETVARQAGFLRMPDPRNPGSRPQRRMVLFDYEAADGAGDR